MPDQDNFIEVATSNYAIGHYPQVLRTTGIGSCIVICLYDRKSKTGSLAHIMLPQNHKDDEISMRYVDSAIPIIVDNLTKLHISKTDLEATLVGGANMFPDLWSGEKAIGNANIDATRKILKQLGIPIVREEVGGTNGRSLEFELEYGKVLVISKEK